MVDDKLIAAEVTAGWTNPTKLYGIVYKPLQMNVDFFGTILLDKLGRNPDWRVVMTNYVCMYYLTS